MRQAIHHRVITAASIVSLVVAQTKPAWADCANDSQCKGDRICEKGQCVSPPAPKVNPLPPPAPPPAAAPVPSGTPTAPPPAPPAAGAPAVKPPPPPGSVHIVFEGKEDTLVTMESKGVRSGECRMPCSLDLLPGEYSLHSKGYDEEVEIPTRNATVAFKRACIFCYITGPIFIVVGAPLIVGGGILADHHSSRPAGIALGVAGSVIAASGIALLVIGIAAGGRKVVVKEREDATNTSLRHDGPKPSFALSDDGVGFTF